MSIECISEALCLIFCLLWNSGVDHSSTARQVHFHWPEWSTWTENRACSPSPWSAIVLLVHGQGRHTPVPPGDDDVFFATISSCFLPLLFLLSASTASSGLLLLPPSPPTHLLWPPNWGQSESSTILYSPGEQAKERQIRWSHFQETGDKEQCLEFRRPTAHQPPAPPRDSLAAISQGVGWSRKEDLVEVQECFRHISTCSLKHYRLVFLVLKSK